MLERLETLLTPAIERSRGRSSFASILNEVAEGQSVVWAAFKGGEMIAAATTSVIEFPHKRVLRFTNLGGENFTELLTSEPQVLDFAVKHGCQAIELIGRPGWERVLTKHGFEKTHIVMEKVIDERTDDARDAANGADDGANAGSAGRDAPGDASAG